MQALGKLYLCISYEMHGNYTKMDDIMKRSGILDHSSSRYFQYNLFHALFMEGTIDLVWEESGITWCVNKRLIVANDRDERYMLENSNSKMLPGVKVSYKSQPLTYSREISYIDEKISFDRICSIGEVVDDSVVEEAETFLSGGDLEVYSYKDNKWDQREFLYDESVLLRRISKYSGYKYYIFVFDSNTTFRVIEPEWLFIISAYMLNYDFGEIFKLNDQSLNINSSFRLPTVLTRYLFDNSKNVELDYINSYRGISVNSIDRLFEYLTPWRAS